jgi:purine-binding chemotaxis protein CheW
MSEEARTPAHADALERALAARNGDDEREVDVDAPTRKLVVFTITGALYALPAAQVVRVLAPEPVYPVPGCPRTVEGVIDVRGTIWSVIRLAELIGAAAGPVPEDGLILLARSSAMESGLRVDRVLDVLDVPESELVALPETVPERIRPLATALFDYRGAGAAGNALVLDAERLFGVWRSGTG